MPFCISRVHVWLFVGRVLVILCRVVRSTDRWDNPSGLLGRRLEVTCRQDNPSDTDRWDNPSGPLAENPSLTPLPWTCEVYIDHVL